MFRIMVNKKCKTYTKADHATKLSIYACLKKLANKLDEKGDDLKLIFNNDSIIYDRINSEIYVCKDHGFNGIQLRIVFGAIKTRDVFTVYFIDLYYKKQNNKSYIASSNLKYKNTAIADFEFEDMLLTL